MKFEIVPAFRKKSYYSLLLFIFFACNQPSEKRIPSSTKLDIADSLKIKLLGKWGGIGESIPVWEIKQDSIYYYDRSITYPYSIIDGNIIVDFYSSRGILKNILVINDTIFFENELGVPIRGYRFR